MINSIKLFSFARIMFVMSVVMAIAFLGSCSPDFSKPKQGTFEPSHEIQEMDAQPASKTKEPSLSVADQKTLAFLLPLSGQHARAGAELLNAAQLALFDINDPAIVMMPLDTKGTAEGVEDAVSQAARAKAGLIIGPLLADSVQQAGAAALRHDLQVIGLTTDSRISGENLFTIGILPQDQGERLAAYAAAENLKRIVLITSDNDYARAVVTAFQKAAQPQGIQIIQSITIKPGDNMTYAVQRLTLPRGQFDAIFMPLGNPQISELAQALTNAGMGANIVPWLGVGLWDDASITRHPAMQGAIFAAPPTSMRQGYEAKYRSIFGDNPSRISSLGYDATALGAALLKQTKGERPVSHQSILNPNGFIGVDGIFRFKPNGQAQRGLAIHRIIGQGQTTVVIPAPTSFVE